MEIHNGKIEIISFVVNFPSYLPLTVIFQAAPTGV
jgi:hypothetical protein